MNKEIVSFNLPDKVKHELMSNANNALNQAKEIKVTSDVTFKDTGEILKQIKVSVNNLEVTRKKFTQPLDIKKKEIMSFFNPIKDQLKQAEALLKNKLIGYDKTKKAQELKLYEAELKKQQQAEARLLKQADKLRAQGKEELASIKEEKASDIGFTTPAIKVNEHKIEGVSTRSKYRGNVLDKLAVVRWVINHVEYIDIIDINQGKLNKLAQATKGVINIDGVKIIKEDILSARTR